jgi:hypothetical protein
MHLFVDTEFADVHARELVSLALVSADGAFEFYAERDPLPASPTDFVRSVVYPRLDRGVRALIDEQFTPQLQNFLAQVQTASPSGRILVAYDFAADVHLLDFALAGFKSPQEPPPTLYEVFDLCRLGGDYALVVDDIFETHPEARARRHHALIDARVNRDAYRALVELLGRQPDLFPPPE